MRRFTSILIFVACLALLPVTPARAWFFDNGTLVSIGGHNYTADDFKHWWKFWNDDNSPLPKTPDPYIDWLLLSQEGKSMDLANDPGFKHETRVFIQSRALLMLKYEEVDSRIKVSDADIKKRYEKVFLPRWLVQTIIFKDDNAATAVWKEISAGTLTVDKLLKRNPEQGGPASYNENWVRPNQVDAGWVTILQNVPVGKVVDPSKHKKGPVLYFVKDKKAGDKEDLAKLSKDIKSDLWRERESVLTRELLVKLRAKYKVKVDEKRLAALNLSAPAKTFTDAPIITTSRENVTEKQFIAVIGRLLNSRTTVSHALSDKEQTAKLKAETVNNILAQSLTNWESMERHYEEKDPFKQEYDFNFQHRLYMALQNRLFESKGKVTDDEITQYYKKNIARYTQPTLVKLYIIDDTQGSIKQIWADFAAGEKFDAVMKKYIGAEAKPIEAPVNHLDPEVKAVVDKLTDGETSQVFKAQGSQVIVHLVQRTPEAPIPLERVKDSIRTDLEREKIDRLRKTYLDTLKSRAQIEINQRQWETVRKDIEAEAAKQKEREAAKQKTIEAAKQKTIEAAKQKELGGK